MPTQHLTLYPGENYRYPCGLSFKLEVVTDYGARFACGHWCTDTVLPDLIREASGLPVWAEPPTLFDLNLTH